MQPTDPAVFRFHTFDVTRQVFHNTPLFNKRQTRRPHARARVLRLGAHHPAAGRLRRRPERVPRARAPAPAQPAGLDHEGGPDAVDDRLEGDDGDLGRAWGMRQRP